MNRRGIEWNGIRNSIVGLRTEDGRPQFTRWESSSFYVCKELLLLQVSSVLMSETR